MRHLLYLHKQRRSAPILKCTGRFNHLPVLPPGEPRPCGQIRQVGIMGIRLALEGVRAVSPALVMEQLDEPLHEVPDVEEHIEHLLHLRRVDALVVHAPRTHVAPAAHEQHAEQVDGLESLERDDVVVDDLHGLILSRP